MQRRFSSITALLLAVVSQAGAVSNPVRIVRQIPPSMFLLKPTVGQKPVVQALNPTSDQADILADGVLNQGEMIAIPLHDSVLLVPRTLDEGAKAAIVPMAGEEHPRLISLTNELADRIHSGVSAGDGVAVHRALNDFFTASRATNEGPSTLKTDAIAEEPPQSRIPDWLDRTTLKLDVLKEEFLPSVNRRFRVLTVTLKDKEGNQIEIYRNVANPNAGVRPANEKRIPVFTLLLSDLKVIAGMLRTAAEQFFLEGRAKTLVQEMVDSLDLWSTPFEELFKKFEAEIRTVPGVSQVTFGRIPEGYPPAWMTIVGVRFNTKENFEKAGKEGKLPSHLRWPDFPVFYSYSSSESSSLNP